MDIKHLIKTLTSPTPVENAEPGTAPSYPELPRNLTGPVLDHHAATILRNATTAVQKILERRAALDREGRTKEPLVVLAGERHSISAHYVLHALILKMLKQSGMSSLMVGYEGEQDFFDQLAFATDVPDNPVTQSILHDRKKSGFVEAMAYMAVFASPWAHHARQAFLSSVFNLTIPFHPVDISKAELIQALPDQEGDGKTNKAIALRNKHMVTYGLERARYHNATLLYLPCGASHVMGQPGTDTAKDSLSALLKEQATPVLAMQMIHRCWPSDHGLGADEFLQLNKLHEIETDYNADTNRFSELQTPEHEIAYVNALSDRLGLRLHDPWQRAATPSTCAADTQCLYTEMKRNYQKIMAQHMAVMRAEIERQAPSP